MGCNDGFIDPADSAVIEARDAGDTGGDEAAATDGPVLRFDQVARNGRGLAARVCVTGGELELASVEARFGETLAEVRPVGACVMVEAATVPTGKQSLRVSARTTAGEALSAWLPLWNQGPYYPRSWDDALLYMVMIDRFRDSDGQAAPEPGVEPIANWQGGDLGGLAAAIDEGWFDELGVDTLWLTPALDNPDGAFLGKDGVHRYSGYHGYWPMSAERIEEHFAPAGTTAEAAFDAVIAKAHARGMRVVYDTVLNHVHEQHPYCVERPAMCKHTCVCGTDGCDWEARALDCQFASYLPDLDYRDPETLARVVDDLFRFVARHDLDGLRVDAVKHMDKAVLRAIRARVADLEAQGADPFWLVGETFAGAGERGLVASFVGPDMLDGQFDFPLFWQIRDTFVNDASFRDLEGALAASEAAYGDAIGRMSPFVGNHDVERLATVIAKNDLGPWGGTIDVLAGTSGDTPSRWDIINPYTMAMAFTLTLPGIPLLYMGDELGLGGSNDPDNRRMMPTVLSPDEREILRRVRELGRARREHPVLQRAEGRRELWMDDDVYLQARWGSSGRPMIIAMNKGPSRTITVSLPSELGGTPATFRSVLSDRTLTADDGQLTLTLAEWEYGLFEREP